MSYILTSVLIAIVLALVIASSIIDPIDTNNEKII